ncbi:MAG TPA: peptidoglycan-associated lipoprotein Pal, partial [Allosphingosinicella sp.]|nr:peptidoglycan-associated lipoprotein Pal [Allosphingosinicella sp.]
MRNSPWKVAAIAAALAMTAGCGKKAPKDLPPPPGDSADAGTAGGVDDGSGSDPSGGTGPGSREDFIRSVGLEGDRVFFDTDQFDLDDRDRSTLDVQATWLNRYPNVRVTIEGHADERGTRDYNLALGDRRANAAKNHLAARGVSPDRMTVISYGKERPEALGSDESAWAQNRRAVTVLPQ